MYNKGVQFVCDRCGRTLFMEHKSKGRIPKPLDWLIISGRHYCGKCTEDRQRALDILHEFRKPGNHPLEGEVIDDEP